MHTASAEQRDHGSGAGQMTSHDARLPILTYHHVGTAKPGSWPLLTISPPDFERQIRWLVRHGFTGIRASDWLAYVRGQSSLPSKPVLLTFDDAYADLIENAFPVLDGYRFPATVFVVTSFIGDTNRWDEANGYPQHHLMSAEQIRVWCDKGIDFGAHTRTHPDLRTLSADELTGELQGSKTELESLTGAPVEAFAYPYGYYNEHALRVARDCFDVAFTCDEGLNSRDTDLIRMRRVNAGAAYSWIGQLARTSFGTVPRQLARNAVARVRHFGRHA